MSTANPLGIVISAALLLRWFGETHSKQNYVAAAAAIESAVDTSVLEPSTRTGDLGGSAKTIDVGRALSKAIEAQG